MSTFFGETFDVLCFHMYKLQENISVLRILLEKISRKEEQSIANKNDR